MAKDVNENKKEKKDNKKFLKEFKAELKRVSWPTKKQLVNNTVAVISIVVVIAAVVFVLDVIFENMNKFGVEKLKAIVTSNSSEEDNSDEVQHIDLTGDENTVESEETTVPTVEDGNTVENVEATNPDQTPVENSTQNVSSVKENN